MRECWEGVGCRVSGVSGVLVRCTCCCDLVYSHLLSLPTLTGGVYVCVCVCVCMCV